MSTIAFILIIASLVQFVEIVLKKFIPALYKSLGVYLPLITTNCIVLAVTIANIETVNLSYGFLRAILYALGSGLGFLLALLAMALIREPLGAGTITLVAGKPIEIPFNYFPDDDPAKPPIVSWRAHANLLFSNWLNYFVYQSTPYDIKNI